MDYEYDGKKSERTFRERQIDFDFAARVFDGDFIEYEDQRRDYNERRYIVIGPIEGAHLRRSVHLAERRRRIISARRASRRERNAYHRAIR